MSTVQVERQFLTSPTVVGSTVQVRYILTAPLNTPGVSIASFTDSSIAGWGQNFSFVSSTDMSVGGGTVGLLPVIDNSGANLSWNGNGGALVFVPTPSSSAIVHILYNYDTTTIGGPFGIPFNSPADFQVVFNFGSVSFSFSNSQTITAICVAENTLVKMAERELVKRVQELCAGDRLLNDHGQAVPLLYAVKVGAKSKSFVQIPQHRFGEQAPERELLISQGHPILVDGFSVLPESCCDTMELEQGKDIYTLITPQREFVNMQGVHVATWSQSAWENFVANDPRARNMPWTKIE